jgi:hypothetical protein
MNQICRVKFNYLQYSAIRTIRCDKNDSDDSVIAKAYEEIKMYSSEFNPYLDANVISREAMD